MQNTYQHLITNCFVLIATTKINSLKKTALPEISVATPVHQFFLFFSSCSQCILNKTSVPHFQVCGNS